MKLVLTIAMSVISLLFGCSNDDSARSVQTSSKEHVWSDQVQALETAKEVQGMVNESLERQQNAIDEGRK